MDRQVPKGRQGPNNRQVPSLTPCDMFHLNGHRISMGRQVPRGRQGPNNRQVPSLTPRSKGVIGSIQLVFLCLANRNRKFQFVKFSTEIDQNS